MNPQRLYPIKNDYSAMNQGSKFIFGFGSTCARRTAKILGAQLRIYLGAQLKILVAPKKQKTSFALSFILNDPCVCFDFQALTVRWR